jgi:hypothetical protein
MSEPICGPGTPLAARIETGTWLDCRNWGHLLFWVQVVDVEGGRLTLSDNRSYEAAIIEAEEAAREWGVEVHDLVEAEPAHA